MKDNFSDHAKEYAQFRPHYPAGLFDYLLSLVKEKDVAWDCGTGNGQVAGVLADHFTNVYATDISRQQIEQAVQKENISYSVQAAEQTSFADNQFDLITVAQAIHWFGFDSFYKEVKRTLKPQAVFAVIGYGLLETESALQEVINHFYKDIVGVYWDAERRYIDEAYQTIPFPFKEMQTPVFQMAYQWSFDQLIGYINTWSAVKHYTRKENKNPVSLIENQLRTGWGNESIKEIVFPVLLRIGS